MFGRRRHAAASAAPIVPAVPAVVALPRLADEQIFELVHTRIAAAIGEGGEWVVRRRTEDDTDELFRAVLAHQVALDVTAALRSAQSQLEAGEQLTVSSRTGAIPLVTAPQASTESATTDVESTAPEARIAVSGSEADVAPAAPAADVTTGDLVADLEHAPAHRTDEPEADDDAVLDEEAIALQWEPAPITVWTDLKRPVTGPIAIQHANRELVR
ncbi:hypothetical protein HII28_04145 [Planctomonas sp. JC2975]|uniref:hypothetical protein n=1 Tax=Planctomonas sp. JC2975 TaxID=2729626 RepID=UPI0014742B0D|nr:hypothetical protein [Planctomonas sp. JC2975]NNC11071.1 hypothetical protein [Planctomonas sp. JC2975]